MYCEKARAVEIHGVITDCTYKVKYLVITAHDHAPETACRTIQNNIGVHAIFVLDLIYIALKREFSRALHSVNAVRANHNSVSHHCERGPPYDKSTPLGAYNLI